MEKLFCKLCNILLGITIAFIVLTGLSSLYSTLIPVLHTWVPAMSAMQLIFVALLVTALNVWQGRKGTKSNNSDIIAAHAGQSVCYWLILWIIQFAFYLFNMAFSGTGGVVMGWNVAFIILVVVVIVMQLRKSG